MTSKNHFKNFGYLLATFVARNCARRAVSKSEHVVEFDTCHHRVFMGLFRIQVRVACENVNIVCFGVTETISTNSKKRKQQWVPTDPPYQAPHPPSP